MRKFSGPISFAALLAILLWAYTSHSNFPFYYHTDEPGKVNQIISGTRNYHHPLVLINGTDLIVRAFNIEKSPQKVVLVGRWFSAAAVVAAIGAIVLLTRRLFGWTFSLLAGLLAGLHPIIFEVAHYMKEDAALAAGLAWSLYALKRICDSEWKRFLVLLGVASGFAISAKYIGALILIPAVGVVYWKSRTNDWKSITTRLALMLGVCAATFVVINIQAVVHPNEAVFGVGQEFVRMHTLEGRFFQTDYFRRVLNRAGVPLILGGVAYLIRCVFDRKRKEIFEWASLGFMLLYLIALCLTPLGKDRYLVPVLMILVVFAVSGVRSLAMWAGERWRKFPQFAGGIVGCAAMVAGQLPTLFRYQWDFAHDVRTEMAIWIKQNLPPASVIALEMRDWPSWDPNDWRNQLPQRRLSPPNFSLEMRNIDNMRRLGVTHFVAAGRGYRNIIEAQAGVPPVRNQLYGEVEKNAIVLWQRPAGGVLYLQPGLTLYALPAATPAH